MRTPAQSKCALGSAASFLPVAQCTGHAVSEALACRFLRCVSAGYATVHPQQQQEATSASQFPASPSAVRLQRRHPLSVGRQKSQHGEEGEHWRRACAHFPSLSPRLSSGATVAVAAAVWCVAQSEESAEIADAEGRKENAHKQACTAAIRSKQPPARTHHRGHVCQSLVPLRRKKAFCRFASFFSLQANPPPPTLPTASCCSPLRSVQIIFAPSHSRSTI